MNQQGTENVAQRILKVWKIVGSHMSKYRGIMTFGAV